MFFKSGEEEFEDEQGNTSTRKYIELRGNTYLTGGNPARDGLAPYNSIIFGWDDRLINRVTYADSPLALALLSGIRHQSDRIDAAGGRLYVDDDFFSSLGFSTAVSGVQALATIPELSFQQGTKAFLQTFNVLPTGDDPAEFPYMRDKIGRSFATKGTHMSRNVGIMFNPAIYRDLQRIGKSWYGLDQMQHRNRFFNNMFGEIGYSMSTITNMGDSLGYMPAMSRMGNPMNYDAKEPYLDFTPTSKRLQGMLEHPEDALYIDPMIKHSINILPDRPFYPRTITKKSTLDAIDSVNKNLGLNVPNTIPTLDRDALGNLAKSELGAMVRNELEGIPNEEHWYDNRSIPYFNSKELWGNYKPNPYLSIEETADEVGVIINDYINTAFARGLHHEVNTMSTDNIPFPILREILSRDEFPNMEYFARSAKDRLSTFQSMSGNRVVGDYLIDKVVEGVLDVRSVGESPLKKAIIEGALSDVGITKGYRGFIKDGGINSLTPKEQRDLIENLRSVFSDNFEALGDFLRGK
jgi:hypothetical protein